MLFPISRSFKSNTRDAVEHRNQQRGGNDEGRDGQASDLRVAQRPPQRAPVTGERNKREDRRTDRDQDRPQPFDSRVANGLFERFALLNCISSMKSKSTITWLTITPIRLAIPRNAMNPNGAPIIARHINAPMTP